jgi:hypothetical protein
MAWSTLLWTYLIPILPIVVLIDSIVSMLRMYNTEELRGLTTGLDRYHWCAGTVRARPIPFPVVYLVGIPNRQGPGITPSRSAVS